MENGSSPSDAPTHCAKSKNRKSRNFASRPYIQLSFEISNRPIMPGMLYIVGKVFKSRVQNRRDIIKILAFNSENGLSKIEVVI